MTNRHRKEIMTPTTRIQGTVEVMIKTTVNKTDGKKPIKVWGIYYPPEGAHQPAAHKEREDIAENLGQAIWDDEDKFHQILMGDTNARIGNANDDKLEMEEKKERWPRIPRKNNPDEKTHQN